MEPGLDVRAAFRRNVLTACVGAFFTTAGILTYALRSEDKAPDDKMGRKIAENDFTALLGTFREDFPAAYKKIKGDLNGHLLMTSPLFDLTRNQYSVDNVKELDAIFASATSETVAEKTVEALEIFEGLERRAYDDGCGFRTIAMGVRLYKNEKHPRSQMVARHLGKNMPYRAVYDGEAALSLKQARLISSETLREKDGFLDILDKSVQRALKAEPREGTDALRADRMHPRYKTMLATMVFQCPDVLTRDPDKTFEDIRTLCDAAAAETAQRDAMRHLIDVYRADKLLKNQQHKAFAAPRVALAIRADCLSNCTVGDVDGAQQGKVIAQKINAMRRDQHDHAVILLMGVLPPGTGLADILNDPACGWKQGGKNMIYMPATKSCATQKQGGFEISYAEKGKGSDFVLVPSLAAQTAPKPALRF